MISIDDETGLAQKDSNESLVYVFDYDVYSNLPAGVGLVTVGTFTIEVESGANTTPLTKDNELLLSAVQASTALGRTVTGDGRATRLRLKDGTIGTTYVIRNLVTTNEVPAQIKEKYFRLQIKS